MRRAHYVALLDGGKREESIGVTQVGPGLYEVEVRGRVHQVDAFAHDFGTVSLLVDTVSYSVQLDKRRTDVRVHVRDSVFPIEILDERRLRMRRASGRSAREGRHTIAATMPGRVAKVLVKVGDAVKAGQGIVVVEAMKMENEMRSPKDGTVVELLVSDGQPVENGAKLATVE